MGNELLAGKTKINKFPSEIKPTVCMKQHKQKTVATETFSGEDRTFLSGQPDRDTMGLAKQLSLFLE